MKNIPIYRAKRIDSEDYVYGYYTERISQYPSGRHYIHFHNGTTATYEKIDPTTLSIHFPDMLDSQGNKIFASLQDDGKGGDKTDYGKVMIFDSIETIPYFESWSNYTVTGIQE